MNVLADGRMVNSQQLELLMLFKVKSDRDRIALSTGNMRDTDSLKENSFSEGNQF